MDKRNILRLRVHVHEVHRESPSSHAERQDTDQRLHLMSRLLLVHRGDAASNFRE